MERKVSGESLGAKLGEAEGGQDKEEGQVLLGDSMPRLPEQSLAFQRPPPPPLAGERAQLPWPSAGLLGALQRQLEENGSRWR